MKKAALLYLILIGLLCFSEAFAQAKKSKKQLNGAQQGEESPAVQAAFADGVRLFMIEQYPAALIQFEKALSADPQNSGILYKTAETLQKLNKTAEAISFAEKAVLGDQKNKYYYLLLIELYRKELKLDLATKTYLQMLEEVPGTKEYHYELASLYLYMGKYKESLEQLNKFEQVFGLNEEVVKQKQYIYLRQNKLDKALEEGQRLISSNPDEPRFLINQAEILNSNNRNKEAKALMEDLLKKKPGFSMAHLMLHNIYKSEGKNAEAEQQLRMAFKDPDLSAEQKINIIAGYLNLPGQDHLSFAKELTQLTLDTHPTDARAYALMGDIRYTQQDKVEALLAYRKSISLDPSNFSAWRQLIIVEYELAYYDSMVAHASEAVELFPSQGLIWFFKGTGELLLKKYSAAALSLEQAKTLNKAQQEIYLQVLAQLGDTYHYLKEHEKSDASYEEVLKKDPENAIARNNYAYFLSLRGANLNKAKDLVAGLVDKEPNNATYLDTYAWVLYKLGEFENARKYLEKAVENDSGNGVILEHLGDAWYQTGNAEKALEFWKKAKEKGETSTLIDKKILDKKLYE